MNSYVDVFIYESLLSDTQMSFILRMIQRMNMNKSIYLKYYAPVTLLKKQRIIKKLKKQAKWKFRMMLVITLAMVLLSRI